MKHYLLREFRKTAKLTQKEIAEKLEISFCHYNEVETGKTSPRLDLIEKAIKILELTDNQIIELIR